MLKKLLVILTTLSVLFPTGVVASARPVSFVAYDQSPLLKEMPAPAQAYPAGIPPSEMPDGSGDFSDPPLHNGGSPDLSLTLFDFSSSATGPHQVPFWREYAGTHADIYVGWNDLQAPAASSQQDQTITAAEIAWIGQQFDQQIWESDVFHFGNYVARCTGLEPGDNTCGTGERAAIMIYNIRDDAYWSSFRFYIAGFFWSSLNDALGVNAVFVDSFDWKNRVGDPSTAPWTDGNTSNDRPLLYDGTVAHEFEHLIHNDVDPDEDSFIDEGMADLAEQFIYGPVTTASHVANYLFYHRDSLTDWDGELYDYGNGVLWEDYLWERNGGTDLDAPLAGRVTEAYAGDKFADTSAKFTDPGDAFTWDLIHDQANGLAGVANQVGGMAQVKALHRDYTLANLLDGKVAEPEWNYQNLVLDGVDSLGYGIEDGIAFYDSNVQGNMPPTRKNVRRLTITEPWGAYYRTFGGSEPGVTVAFRGSTQDGVSPYTGASEWYSGLGNGLERTLQRAFSVSAGDTLSFRTWFDIEPDWDYGYVEASGDGGVTWTKLTQTTSLRVGASNVNGSSAWDGPGGFTGNSGGWQQATFGLGGFSGSTLIRLRYNTDEAVNGQGWYIDDVAVGATSDPIDAVGSWTTNGWLFTNGLQNNDWSADAYSTFAKGLVKGYYWVEIELTPDGTSVSGSTWIEAQYARGGKVYGIVSNRPDGVFDARGRLTISKSQ